MPATRPQQATAERRTTAAGITPIEPYAMPTSDTLPLNIAGWTVHPDRAVLLLHDMQRYFLRPLPDQPGTNLLRNTATLRKHCAVQAVPVAYTVQPGGMTAVQRGLLKDFWGPGMRMAPADRKLVDPLTPSAGDWVFTKWRYSAFFKSALLDSMRSANRDQLIIAGVYAHVGILATAVDAFSNNIETFVVADAVADFSERHHRMALEYAAALCAVVLTTEEVLA